MSISSSWKNKVHGGNSEFLSYKKKMQAGKYFLNHYIYIYIYIMVFMITKKFILIFIYFLDENKSKYRILNPIIQKLNY